eukprot:SAG31_NODE_20016_length_586_cov_0.790554_1_plen_68_part_01
MMELPLQWSVMRQIRRSSITILPCERSDAPAAFGRATALVMSQSTTYAMPKETGQDAALPEHTSLLGT